MLQNMNANRWIKLLAVLSVITYLYFIYMSLSLRGYDDDQVFLNIFNSNNILEHLLTRFETWSGRFSVELVMTSTIGYSMLWKLGVPTSILILCVSCNKIADLELSCVSIALSFILFASIPADIHSDASWWITGFYNYLLPVSAATYTFSTLTKKETNTLEKIACILLAFYFPYMEQAGISFLVATACLAISKRNSISRFELLIALIVIINLTICLAAPGNINRFILESWHWYPQYQTYGLTEKISLGFDKLHQLMTLRLNFPLMALSVVLFILRSSLGEMCNAIKIAMLVISTFIAVSIANSFTGLLYNGAFFSGKTIDATRWSSITTYISYSYMLAVISSILIVLIECNLKRKINSTSIIAMLIGFMTVTMLGFSPTVYASGFRVDLIFEIMCIISFLSIWAHIKTNKNK
ncbi:hypothetical protein [Enterobacter roggenkampii]|uniref:hypothetical protein n=1 Tax=Enterobacter roggenkampii TaxID=1812935 RepID=UPI000B105A18|nr:hypothetical protein [Enterobacter roggenkampii]QWZ74479.1 hypothetical protein I6L60_07680 [Enterobacter roggenkampii]